MIETRLLAFFCFIKRRFLIYDLDFQIGVENFVVAKRVIGTVDTKDIIQATFVVNRWRRNPRVPRAGFVFTSTSIGVPAVLLLVQSNSR